MEKKTAVFFWVIGFAITSAICVTYWRIYAKRDYPIIVQVDCDPSVESCFIYRCNPIEEECTGNPDEDTWYYKMLVKNAAFMPQCNPREESCQSLLCREDEECEVVFCNVDNEEDAECTNPEEFEISTNISENEDDSTDCSESEECDDNIADNLDSDCDAESGLCIEKNNESFYNSAESTTNEQIIE